MSTLNPKNKRTAMSLAELLLTMTIIGVIASYTIPVVMKNIQDATLRTAWKQYYSILNQAAKRVALDNAGTFKGAFADNAQLRDKFKIHMNYIKECEYNASFDICFTRDTDAKILNGSSASGMYGNDPTIVLSNGMSLLFTGSTLNCTANFGSIYYCGGTVVDVNGLKGPNTLGRDIFMVYITEYGVKPYGTQGDTFENTCSLSSSGLGCAAKFLQNYDLNL